MSEPTKLLYRFSLKDCDAGSLTFHPKTMKEVLGGKGAGLVDMCNAGLPVPPGFTIHTGICNQYRALGAEYVAAEEADLPEMDKKLDAWRSDLMHEVVAAMLDLGEVVGFQPLVSVRSGAPVSMPGMMDTILNVGMNDETLPVWVKRIGERPAWDSYRRLIQMLGHTAYNIPDDVFENILKKHREEEKVETDAQLSVEALKSIVGFYKKAFQAATQEPFPQDTYKQLRAAIMAVFESWMNPRAIEYRKINKISDDMGTAVTVQAMVFGNMGETSGSGVLFTRNPSDGAIDIMAEYLPNAQGEDVVAGIRTPEELNLNYISGEALEEPSEDDMPAWCYELVKVCDKLEKHYRDMVDVEFTVMEGKLYILQSRVGKRSAAAAFQIAVSLVNEGMITREEALKRLTVDQFKIMRRPIIDPSWAKANMHNHIGLPACPGVAVGVPVFSAEDAVNCTEPCILVTHETTPDDIAGMHQAAGILTQTGGATSHAAVVARGMDKPCIVGCTELDIVALMTWANTIGGEGEKPMISIDGSTGWVWLGVQAPIIDNTESDALKIIQQWSLEITGLPEQVVVDPDEVTHPVHIMACHWWGDEDVMDTVLDGLSVMSIDDRAKVTLNLSHIKEFTPLADLDLKYAFEAPLDVPGNVKVKKGKEETFIADVLSGILMRQLKGITVVGDLNSNQVELLTKIGVKVPKAPKTVADLLSGSATAPSNDFINEVIGGHEAWKTLGDILKGAGVGVKVVARAVPAEYATFKALAG